MLYKCNEVKNVSVKKKLIKNTIVNYSIKFWGLILTFFLFRFIVGHIGETDYGIYLFVTAITGYFSVLDLGIGNSLVKFMAEFEAKGDKEKLNQVFNTTFFLFLFIGLVGGIIMFFIGTFLLSFFAGIFPGLDSPDFIPKARAIIYLLGIGFIFSLAMSSLRGILAGLQRYDILAIIGFIMSIINLSVVIIILTMGLGIVELVLYTVLTGLIGFILMAYGSKHERISSYHIHHGYLLYGSACHRSIFRYRVNYVLPGSLEAVWHSIKDTRNRAARRNSSGFGVGCKRKYQGFKKSFSPRNKICSRYVLSIFNSFDIFVQTTSICMDGSVICFTLSCSYYTDDFPVFCF
jgi:O-antigen/teichoic acid export membrane protein